MDYEGIMRSMRSTGYQATNLGLAVEEVAVAVMLVFVGVCWCLLVFVVVCCCVLLLVDVVVTRVGQVNKMLRWLLRGQSVTANRAASVTICR